MKRLMWMVFLALMVVGFAQDEMMMSHADVRYIHITGSGMYEGVVGTATIITWDTGEHEVLVRLEGLWIDNANALREKAVLTRRRRPDR